MNHEPSEAKKPYESGMNCADETAGQVASYLLADVRVFTRGVPGATDLLDRLRDGIDAAIREAAIRARREADEQTGLGELVKALRTIEAWRDFPPTGQTWDNADRTPSDRPMSYGACYGSNGERDYMRRIARAALTQHQRGDKPNG